MHNSQQKDDFHLDALPCLEEHDLSPAVFEKMLEYMYTDGLKDIDPKQAEELFDAASRYLLFSLKRAAVEVLLPHLKMASPVELCDWLLLADVTMIARHNGDIMACTIDDGEYIFDISRFVNIDDEEYLFGYTRWIIYFGIGMQIHGHKRWTNFGIQDFL